MTRQLISINHSDFLIQQHNFQTKKSRKNGILISSVNIYLISTGTEILSQSIVKPLLFTL